jgi:hypothetical protein
VAQGRLFGRPQAPPPHAPAPQPASGTPQAEAAVEAEGAPTANTDSCFSTEALRQPGQLTSSEKRRTSFSKRLPQPEQAYS